MIKREIFNNILPWLGKEKILILKGARQVGKTYLMTEIKEYLENDKNQVIYLLADNPDNKNIFSSLTNLKFYLEKYTNFPNQFIYLMIDEFQVINEPGLFLKNIFDAYKNKIQLIVSGSSALAINKNSEYLTGRAIHFNIDRISFKEYFDYKEGINNNYINIDNLDQLKLFWQNFEKKLNLYFKDYISFGSYPEVIITKNIDQKEIILKSIIKTYIEKDIINQLKIENIDGFNDLIKVLASQIGQLVNKQEISNTINLSINTLNKYLEILVGTYIINLVKPYYKNIRTEISKMPKVYLLDMGIYNYLLRSFTMDLSSRGEVIENFIYKSLLNSYSKEYIHFYRTVSGSEIDFVIEDDNNKLTIYEVKYRNKIQVPLAIKNFSNKFDNLNKKIIITKNELKKEKDIYFIPALLFPFIKLK